MNSVCGLGSPVQLKFRMRPLRIVLLLASVTVVTGCGVGGSDSRATTDEKVDPYASRVVLALKVRDYKECGEVWDMAEAGEVPADTERRQPSDDLARYLRRLSPPGELKNAHDSLVDAVGATVGNPGEESDAAFREAVRSWAQTADVAAPEPAARDCMTEFPPIGVEQVAGSSTPGPPPATPSSPTSGQMDHLTRWMGMHAGVYTVTTGGGSESG